MIKFIKDHKGVTNLKTTYNLHVRYILLSILDSETCLLLFV